MESEKVKEIKKALEICVQQGNSYCHEEKTYEQCPYYEDCKKAIHENNPQSLIMEHALSLINELESENERLVESCKNCHYIKDLEIANGHAKELKDRIAELEMGIEALSFALKQGFNDCQTKTLKQFAKRLKGRFDNCVGDFYHGDTIYERIDETLKEFIKE